MSHFNAIGLQVGSQEEFGRMLAELSKQAIEVPPDPETGSTLLWTDGQAEVWFHPDANWCIVPAFRSKRAIRALPKARRPSPDGCPYCAMLDIEVLDTDAVNQSLFPLAVTSGNIRSLYREVVFDQPISLGLTVFLEQIERVANPSQSTALDSQEGDVASQLATRIWQGGFFPLGPFNALGPTCDEPRARINGKISSTEILANSHTSQTYQRLEIESTGGKYEVVSEVEIIAEYQVGECVSIEGWVCATSHTVSSPTHCGHAE